MSAIPPRKMSLQEFLEWENAQPERHEYYRGEVFAMVGAWRVHGRVVMNLTRALGNALHGSPCQVFAQTMKVQLDDEALYYPDVFVTCDRADLATDLIFRSPKVIVEVLSPSTQAYDRSGKFAVYRRIDALLEYVLVDPDTRRVEAFRRDDKNQWVLHDMSDGATLMLPAIGVTVPLGELFDGIEPAD